MDKKRPEIRSRVQSDSLKLNVKFFVCTTRGQYYPTKCLHSKVPSRKLNRRLQLTTRVSHLYQWLEFAYKQQFCLQCRRLGFDSWVGKIPWRKKWQPTPVFLPGEFHGQRNLVCGVARVRHDWAAKLLLPYGAIYSLFALFPWMTNTFVVFVANSDCFRYTSVIIWDY